MLLGTTSDGPVPGRRVAVTGIGVVAHCGIGARAFWDGLLGPRPVGDGRIGDFDPTAWLAPKEARRLDRFVQLSVAAVAMATESSGDLTPAPGRAGVVFGTALAGIKSFHGQMDVLRSKGPRRVSPYLIPTAMPNAAAAVTSMLLGWQGPCETVSTSCAAGTHAISAAARLVASGRCDVAIAGGADSATSPLLMAAFTNAKALSKSGVARPFDARRDGFVMAEGAAALVLEELDHARRRAAPVYGEVLGASSAADTRHGITADAGSSATATTCMELALADSAIDAGSVGHISAHGIAMANNDLCEAQAIAALLDKAALSTTPPITATKGATGHTLGASGVIEAVATLLSMQHRLIAPTAGYSVPDPDIALDVVHGTARPWTPGPVLMSSFGFGGRYGSLVLAPVAD